MKKLIAVVASLLFAGLAYSQDTTPSQSHSLGMVSSDQPQQPEVFDQAIINTALKEVGVVKQVDYESDRVKQYVDDTDQDADEYYQDGWCNGFVSWVLKQNGYEFASMNTTDEINRFFKQVDKPKIGDVVIIPGHIAFYAGEATFPGLENAILLLGGNQGHMVCELPLNKAWVQEYLEPIKAPKGWTPSHRIEPSDIFGTNKLNDKSPAMDDLDKNIKTQYHSPSSYNPY